MMAGDVMNDVLMWLGLVVHVLFGLATIGAGAAYVRKAHAGAGYTLVAAGAITVLGACCARGAFMLARSEGGPLFAVPPIITYARIFLTVVLIAVAIVMIANKIKDAKKAA